MYSRTIAKVSSVIARSFFKSISCLRFNTGRTCRQPTEAWAYQVPVVPCFTKSSLRRLVYSARSANSTAQSSMQETGFPSPFIDIMMLSPDFRTSQISSCNTGSIASTKEFENPCADISSSKSCSFFLVESISSPENSTSRSDPGLPLTKCFSFFLNCGICAASSSIVRSTNSTASGSSSTRYCVVTIAS